MSRLSPIKTTVGAFCGVLLVPLLVFSQSPSGLYFGEKAPGLTPQPFGRNFISKDQIGFAGVFSPDGTEFFFTRRLNPKSTDNSLFYTKMTDGRWLVPQRASFGMDCDEMEPHFSPDGKRLYFGSIRPKPSGDVLRGDIWYSERTESGWSSARHLQAPLNKDFAMYISTARNGSLYATAMLGDRVGIGYCSYANSEYGALQLLSVVDPPLRAAHPFVAPDESYLIFDAQGPGANSNADLYVSFRNADGSWNKGLRLPASVNSEATELCPTVSPDGKYLFFSRFIGGIAEIYWVDFKIVLKLKQP